MSRTVRCKGSTPSERSLISKEEHANLVTSKDVFSYRWFRRNWAHLIKPTFKETRKAELKKAHSDHGWKYFWAGTPPAHFRRDLNAQRRASDKQSLIKAVRRDFGESYLPKRPGSLKDVWYQWD